MTYRIRNVDLLESELRRIARAEIRGALAQIRNAHSRPNAVHAVRAHCKKVRALLRLVRFGLGKQYERENQAFRDIARELAESRDATVIRATFDTLVERGFSANRRSELDRLRARLASGDDSPDEPATLLAVHAPLAVAEGRAATLRLRGQPLNVVALGLRATYGRARKLYTRARTTREPKQFHEWRKHAKHHWYHLELIRPVSSKALPGRMKRMAQLSDVLGDLHDLDVLEAWLGAQAQADRSSKRVTRSLSGLVGARRAELQDVACAMGEALFARHPREIVSAVTATARRTP